VRQEADDRRPLLQFGLEFGDQAERLGVGIIHVEDDQRRLLFAILLHVIEQVLLRLDEFDLHIQLARRLLDLGLKEQVVNEGEDARVAVIDLRQRLGLEGSISRGESRAHPSWPRSVIPAQGGAVAVIHRSAVNAAVLLLAVAAVGRATTIRRTTPASPLASPSPTTGGMSGSCIHIVLVLSVHSVRPKGDSISPIAISPIADNDRFLVKPRFGHRHAPCAENPVRLKLTRECLYSVWRLEPGGAEGQLESMATGNTYDVTPPQQGAQVLSQVVLHNSNGVRFPSAGGNESQV